LSALASTNNTNTNPRLLLQCQKDGNRITTHHITNLLKS
jgi:hypothetical protein